jgi:predicted small metal-binding protein
MAKSKKELNAEMNALLRQAHGLTVEEIEEDNIDMNARLRAARGVVVEASEEDEDA